AAKPNSYPNSLHVALPISLLNASGTRLYITALNEYRAQLPVSDTAKYDVILARRINGHPLRVRDRGPTFIVYPFDQDPDLKSETDRKSTRLNSSHVKISYA